jgi:hypothetical protein
MRRFLGVPLALLLGCSLAAPAAAADPPQVVYPAGVACTFALGISSTDLKPTVYREFFDAEGNLVWSLLAGRGGESTFTNMDTGATFSPHATGSIARTFFHPDGSVTMVFTGGWAVILFPTDVPAGPSTTMILGRGVAEVSADGVWTIQGLSGRQVDICAVLS